MRIKKPVQYVLWYLCPIRGLGGKIARYRMLDRSGATDLEMARALTGDLTKLNIYWEIREASTDIVVDNSQGGSSAEEEIRKRGTAS